MPQRHALHWCIIVRSDNAHDHEVWGPYEKDHAWRIYESLADRSDVRGPVGKLTIEPMSTDWDAENGEEPLAIDSFDPDSYHDRRRRLDVGLA